MTDHETLEGSVGIDPKTDYVRNLQACMLRQKEKASAEPPAGPPQDPR